MSIKPVNLEFQASPLNMRVSAEDVLARIFKRSVAAPLVSDLAINNQFVVANWTMEYRYLQDCIGTFLQTINKGPEVLGLLSSPSMTAAYQGMGTTTALNAVIGLVQAYDRVKKIDKAQKINDKQGVLLGRIALAKDGANICGGVGYGVFRPFTIVNAVTGLSASSLIGKVTYGFGLLGNIGFTLFFVLSAISNTISIYFANKLQNQLAQGSDDQEKLNLIKKKLTVDPTDLREKLIQKKAKELRTDDLEDASNAVDEDLQQYALAFAEKNLKELLKSYQIKASPKELNTILHGLLESSFPGFLDRHDLLVNEGLRIIHEELIEKKEAKLTRFLSRETVEKLKSYFAHPHDVDTKSLVNEVNNSLQHKKLFHAACLVMGILGIAAIGLSMLTPVGWFALAVSIIGIFFCIAMSAIDAYCLLDSLKSDQPSPHDKKFIHMSTISCIASIATVIGLMASGVVSFGTVPLMVTIGLGLIWLAHNAFILDRIDKKERDALFKKINLENLLKLLNSSSENFNANAVLELLPEDIRNLVINKWKELFPSKNKKAALSELFMDNKQLLFVVKKLFEERKEMFEEQNEMIKQSLQSYISEPGRLKWLA